MAVIGTAGHIDHGKTSLVRALTGIDTDRLKEEKARGITIELGFAHLALPSGRTVGVVDVPGHEKFVRTMVAGAVGVDLVVLVVAADEGVMPQTREHLDVCSLLGVVRGVVALTKIDLVDDELRELAELDVRAALEGTPLADAPLVRCSTKTSEGLDALRLAIDRQLDDDATDEWPRRARDGLVRLPIDRVFVRPGFGSVVTGTLWSGRIAVGDDLALPGGAIGKVRGLEQHGESVSALDAGTRAAVNVTLPRESLPRGATLGRAGQLESGRIFDAALRLLPSTRRALRKRARVLLHAGTAQSEAMVRLLGQDSLQPGDTAFVEIESHEPLVLLPGDRFVLRGTTPQKGHGTTIGGGVVVRVLGSRSRRGHRTDPALLQRNLEAQRDDDLPQRVLLEIERAGEAGIDLVALRRRVPGQLDGALATLRSAGGVVRHDKERDAYVSHAALEALVKKARAIVERDLEVPREALRAHVTRDVKLLHLVVERLLTAGGITADRDRLVMPRAKKNDGADVLLARLRDSGLEPPRHVELPALLGWTQATVDKTLGELARDGRVVRTKELSFAQENVDALATRLVAHLEQHGEIDAQGWKALTGVSRKFATPLAEHFDAVKLTLRVADVRRLRR